MSLQCFGVMIGLFQKGKMVFMNQYRVLKLDEGLKGHTIDPILVTEHRDSAIKFAAHLSKESAPGIRRSYLVVKEVATFESGIKR